MGGDGIFNRFEQRLGYDPLNRRSVPADSDGDGWPDALDQDMDNDGHDNQSDAFPLDASEWSDMDGDGIGDKADPDIDGDGISNELEKQVGTDPRNKASVPDDFDHDGRPDVLDEDMDGDGVANAQDQYPRDSAESRDTDMDGIPDNQDPDSDNDGVPDVFELHLGTDPYDAAIHSK